MHRRAPLLALICASFTASLTAAAAPRGSAKTPVPIPAEAGVLQVASGPAVRVQPQVTAGAAPLARRAAWSRFVARAGNWRAVWDRATAIPRQMWGEPMSAPGAVASADSAAAFARSTLAGHIDLLAPGAELADFVLVSNRVDNGVRVVGFAQHHQGVPVLGGQVSFRFKNDRLLLIASQALPDVSIDAPTSAATSPIAPAAAEITSTAWVLSDATTAAVRDVGEPVILPLVGDAGVHRYALVRPVTVDATGPLGRWDVYVDAGNGANVARAQTLMFGAGDVLYNAPIRYPGAARDDYPARDTSTFIDGFDILTDADGIITWQGTAPAQLTTKTAGIQVDVRNQAGDDDVGQFTITDGGQIVWDERTEELIDAQITAYVHTRVVKDYVRTFVADLPFLDEIQVVNVNIDEQCNAFSDGSSINFFQASTQCENTARLADVVYHEFGHSLHAQSIIEGVGQFNGAHSEGLADFLSATLTDDPAMGRGFFLTEAPLRHIDPTDKEHRWPIDLGGVHFTGLIFAGAMWDLRKLLVQRLGAVEGVALANRLYYATLQRATDIPSTYLEVLVEDDDDGSLANGTPNLCDINAAFGAHGLRQLDVAITPLSRELPDEGGHPISVTVGGLFPQCPGDAVDTVTVKWRLADGTPPTDDVELSEVELLENDGAFEGAIPSAADGNTVLFRLDVSLADATEVRFPDNPADPLYQFYVGEVVELYCTDFETDPFIDGWTHGLTSGVAGEGADDWSWGTPRAPLSSGDPPVAFSGDRVIGNDLGGSAGDGDGLYQPNKVNFAMSPAIDVGSYSDVHLQYRRWLNVEDAFFDTASIFVNDQLAWQNFDSQQGGGSAIHHEDNEWRFADVPISTFARDKKVQVRFEINTDPGLEFGGWTIDDFCVVANVNSICGDGTLTGAEQCDDAGANSDTEPDACRTDCRAPICGDGVLDSSEECDDGNLDNLDDCTVACKIPSDGGCGCQGGGGSSALGALLVLLALGARRRRQGRPRA